MLCVSIPSFATDIPLHYTNIERNGNRSQQQPEMLSEQLLVWASAYLLVQLSEELPEQLQRELNIEPGDEHIEKLSVETVSRLLSQFIDIFGIRLSRSVRTPTQLLEQIIEKLPDNLKLQLVRQLSTQTFRQTPARLLVQAIKQSLSEV